MRTDHALAACLCEQHPASVYECTPLHAVLPIPLSATASEMEVLIMKHATKKGLSQIIVSFIFPKKVLA
jgi:hypothetical protein